MKIYFGSLEIELEVEKGVTDVFELKIKDLVQAGVKVKYRKPDKLISPTMRTEMIQKLVKKVPDKDYTRDVNILLESGLSSNTIVMIANKVLGHKTTGTVLKEEFADIEQASMVWLDRKLDKPYWGLYIGTIDLPLLRQRSVAVGLTDKNQLEILSVFKGTPKQMFEDLKARGLKTDVQLGILSFHANAIEDFKEAFPKARVALDWQEFIDLTVGGGNKYVAKQMMLNREGTEVYKFLKEMKAPLELMTYLDFPQGIHRAIRTTAPIRRIQKDLASKLRSKKLKSEQDRSLVLAWSLIRLQYHWFRIPADAQQLNNLRYIQAQYQEERL